MDWSMLEGWLRCEPGSDQLRMVVVAMGGLAAAGWLVVGIEAFRRWRFGTYRGVAKVLQEEGELRARLNHVVRALELYDLSIRLNGRAAHTFYLRGCLWEQRNDPKRAIADWERCLAVQHEHRAALAKLGYNQRQWKPHALAHRGWGYVSLLGAVILVGLLMIAMWA